MLTFLAEWVNSLAKDQHQLNKAEVLVKEQVAEEQVAEEQVTYQGLYSLRFNRSNVD